MELPGARFVFEKAFSRSGPHGNWACPYSGWIRSAVPAQSQIKPRQQLPAARRLALLWFPGGPSSCQRELFWWGAAYLLLSNEAQVTCIPLAQTSLLLPACRKLAQFLRNASKAVRWSTRVSLKKKFSASRPCSLQSVPGPFLRATCLASAAESVVRQRPPTRTMSSHGGQLA